MNVVAICGSLRAGSTTERALSIAGAAAEDAGATVNHLLLRDFELPFCDGRTNEETYGGDYPRFRQLITEADALLVGSPEYHGSLSGPLKNALDLLRPVEMDEKLVGLLATAKGDAGAMNTLNHLRHIWRWMGAWVLPTQVSIPRSQEAFGSAGEVSRAGLAEELDKLGTEVVRYAGLLQKS